MKRPQSVLAVKEALGITTAALLFFIGVASCGKSPAANPSSADSALAFDPNQTVRNDSPPMRFMVKLKATRFESSPWNSPQSGFLAPPLQTFGAAGLPSFHYLRQRVGSEASVHPIVGDLYLVTAEADKNPENARRAVEQLKGASEVEYVEEDPVAFTLQQPNDPLYSQQWAHRNMRSAQAWDLGQGSRNVMVAVIDTGIDHDHPDLAANLWNNPNAGAPGEGPHGWNFDGNNAKTVPDDQPTYHGTHVAGILGAIGNNGLGIIGQSPQVTMMALKFLSASGSGYVSNAVRAIHYAISKKVRIMSNSWGSTQTSQALGEAIAAAQRSGILFIAAAGNGGEDGIGDDNDSVPTYPAGYTYDNVISVAATDSADGLTSFSNYGARTVHLAAPGADIHSTMNGADYQSLSGTSMSTPLVSGLAAAVIARNPNLSYKEVKRILIESSDPIPGLQGRVASNGRVNAHRAMALAGAPVGHLSDPPTIPPRQQ